jgi:hypothetical protein
MNRPNHKITDTQTKMFQEASDYHNHHKPGDTSGIFEKQCHQFP